MAVILTFTLDRYGDCDSAWGSRDVLPGMRLLVFHGIRRDTQLQAEAAEAREQFARWGHPLPSDASQWGISAADREGLIDVLTRGRKDGTTDATTRG